MTFFYVKINRNYIYSGKINRLFYVAHQILLFLLRISLIILKCYLHYVCFRASLLFLLYYKTNTVIFLFCIQLCFIGR